MAMDKSDLLHDAGLSSLQACDKTVSNAVALLQSNSHGTEIIFPHNLMVTYLSALTQSLLEDENKINFKDIFLRVIKDIVMPYFHILSEEHCRESLNQECLSHAQGTESIVNLLGTFSLSEVSSQQCVFDHLSSLVDSVLQTLNDTNESPSINHTAIDPHFLLTFLSRLFRKVSVNSLEEDEVSVSSFFEKLLSLLKVCDTKTCFLLSSSILPHFVTSSHMDRAEKVWCFIESVYSGRVSIEHSSLEVVLTLLCCFRDVFIYHDKSSPFSSPFPSSVIAMAPLVDLRLNHTFWCVIQEGLMSSDPFSRKRCMYLLHCALMSVQDSDKDVCSEGEVFWWAKERSSELKKVWDDLALVLETMEEKQIHIVKPVKKHFRNVLNATCEQSNNGCSLLHVSWLKVTLSRIFDHYEARSIIQWGVMESLGLELKSSPLLQEQHWSFVCGRLLQVLGQSFLYSRSSGASLDPYPPVALQLTHFLQSFVSELTDEMTGKFMSRFLSSCAELKLAEIPLVFITFAFSQLSPMSLIGPDSLAAIRSIVLSSILTHKPSLRAASQTFLLKGVCQLTDFSKVGYLEVLQTLGSFRAGECLRFGSTAWNQASKFLLDYCKVRSSSKNDHLPDCKMGKSGLDMGLFSYLEYCIQAILDVTYREDCPLPTLPSLARALLLALDGECTECERVLSTESRSIDESLTLLLAPVMDTITTASTRAYLSLEVVQNAVQLLHSLLQLVVGQVAPATEDRKICRESTTSTLYTCLLSWLPETMLYVHGQLLESSKEAGPPNLDHILFYLDSLEVLYKFMGLFEFPFKDHPDIQMTNLARKASEILPTFRSKEGPIELSGLFLSSIATLGWISSFVSKSHNSTLFPHQVLSFIIGTALQSLSLPLCVSKPSAVMQEERSGQGTDLSACPSGVKWGPLLSHCHLSYWKCMLYVLKKDEEFARTNSVKDLAQVCLDGLDTADDSLASIIQCFCQLVTKAISEVTIATFVRTVWSFILELRNHHKIFFESLEAFVELLFHHQLLSLRESELNELQAMYAEEFFELGVAKTGISNILVSHVCSAWREGLAISKSESISSPSVEDIFASLRAHKKLLLMACTFGTVHKKNLRIVEETEGFIESVCPAAMADLRNAGSRSDNNVRVKMITFLLEVMGSYGQENNGHRELFQDFLHDFVCCIVKEVLQISEEVAKYYINSHTHRVKLRLLQSLILTLKFIQRKDTCAFVAKQLLLALKYDNQRSVRYLIEWTVVLIFTRFTDLMENTFYPHLKMDSKNRLSRMCSFFTIAMHVGANLTSAADKTKYYLEVFAAVFQWTSCHHFSVRIYSQHAIFKMWDDCKRSKVTCVLDKFCILEDSISFMQLHGDGGKFAHKIEDNVLFFAVDTVKDLSIQTIFHTLPLLCNAPLEDLIETEIFLNVTGGCEEKLFYPLSCKNKSLLEAAHLVLTHVDAGDCGSDTKSIAHQLKSKGKEDEGSLNTDVQKKITPWTNPTAVVNELFPDSLPQPGCLSSSEKETCPSGLILVATLLSKIPNIGGLCRTSEIFGVSELVISNSKVLEDSLFQSLSVTSEKWINVTEVKLNALKDYLLLMQRKGYTLVGAEQTAHSKCITEYSFKRNTLLLLGNEREGIPVDLIHILDDCVEIPQLGVVRSLNVHVSGALLVWEYAKKNLIARTSQH